MPSIKIGDEGDFWPIKEDDGTEYVTNVQNLTTEKTVKHTRDFTQVVDEEETED